MTETTGLREAVKKTAGVDAKLDLIAMALSSQATATLNVLLGVISAVEKLPGADRSQLRKDIEDLKVLPTGDDTDPLLYGQIIDVCLMRLDPTQKP